jgi:hypothetical protein
MATEFADAIARWTVLEGATAHLLARLLAVLVTAARLRTPVSLVTPPAARVLLRELGIDVMPNGQIVEFANDSGGGVRAIVDVPVSGDVPVEQARAVLAEVGAALGGGVGGRRWTGPLSRVSWDSAAVSGCPDQGGLRSPPLVPHRRRRIGVKE